MIPYYNDDYLIIKFDRVPQVAIRYIMPFLTIAEEQEIRRKPFELKEALSVEVIIGEMILINYTIPKGYTFDGCTIPRFFWSILGISKENNQCLISALNHDYLCENKDVIEYDRELSTEIFKALLIAGDIPIWKANIMSFFVDFFQKHFCKGWNI